MGVRAGAPGRVGGGVGAEWSLHIGSGFRGTSSRLPGPHLAAPSYPFFPREGRRRWFSEETRRRAPAPPPRPRGSSVSFQGPRLPCESRIPSLAWERRGRGPAGESGCTGSRGNRLGLVVGFLPGNLWEASAKAGDGLVWGRGGLPPAETGDERRRREVA